MRSVDAIIDLALADDLLDYEFEARVTFDAGDDAHLAEVVRTPISQPARPRHPHHTAADRPVSSATPPSASVSVVLGRLGEREAAVGFFSFDLPPDTRGEKIREYKLYHVPGNGDALLLDCASWIADQFEATFGGVCERGKLNEKAAETYTFGFRFPNGAPPEVKVVVNRLQAALSIPAPENVDFVVALDWYSQPDADGEIVKTGAGNWINWTKHASHPDYSNSRNARREMVRELVGFISEHPLYREATAIVSPPGHLADGNGFGELLAQEVAGRSGIPYVPATSPGPRAEQKENPQDLSGVFTVHEQLRGTVLVLDDVFHTGKSASATAEAAVRAGAEGVLVLTVARTIRR